jgi:hypothetical protein
MDIYIYLARDIVDAILLSMHACIHT